MMKKIAYVVIAVVSSVIVLVAGLFAYLSIQITDDELFRAFVEKGVATTNASQLETYEGTGSKTTLKGVVDIEKKTIYAMADMVCTADVQGEEVSLSATIQQENEKGYYRINSITGNINNSEGNPLDLTNVFSKIKGVWYSTANPDRGIKAQLDSGVMLFNSAVISPNYDSTKVSDALINKKAFTYSSIEKKDGKYVISFSVQRDNYIEAVKEVFPNLSNVDLIMDTIFDDKSSLESTITVNKDGTVLKEKLTNTNLCVEMISTFVGVEPTGLAKSLTGVNEPKPQGSINIRPVTNSKPLDEMSSDFVL